MLIVIISYLIPPKQASFLSSFKTAFVAGLYLQGLVFCGARIAPTPLWKRGTLHPSCFGNDCVEKGRLAACLKMAGDPPAAQVSKGARGFKDFNDHKDIKDAREGAKGRKGHMGQKAPKGRASAR